MSPAPRSHGLLRAATATLAFGNVGAATAALVIGTVAQAPSPAAEARPAPVVAERVSAPATVLAASVHPLLATTSTTSPARGPGRTRDVESTGYCLEGTTSSGAEVGPGMVAMNGVALGSRWLVHDGPFRGATLEVTDRIGHSTEFDIWFDDCTDAVEYGRRTITVERVG